MAQTRSTGQQTEADGPPAPPSVAAWVGLSTQKTRGHGAEATDLFYLSGVVPHAPRPFFAFFTFFPREGAYKRREGGASRRGLSSPLFLTVTVRPCS